MKIVCETATLADAVSKAARVAPSKGSAFDRAAGVMLELNRDADTPLAVRATNIDSTYINRINAIEVDGEGSWRIPSNILAGYLAQLPLTGTIEIEQVADDRVSITADKATAELHLMHPMSFPDFWWVEADDLGEIQDFARRVNQVVFAARRDGDPPLTGVHIDGHQLITCDGTRLASVPCEAPVEAPITVPMNGLAPALKGSGAVRIAAFGDRLIMQPDDDVQATSLIYQPAYPDVGQIKGKVEDGWKMDVGSSVLANVLQRIMVLCKSDRYPLVRLVFSKNAIELDADVPDLGWVREELVTDGGPDEPVEYLFTPTLLTACCSAVGDGVLTITAGHDPLRPALFTGGDGWECVVTPRRNLEQKAA